jgi:hypothetical protein
VNPLNPSWLRAVRISAFCISLIIFVAVVRMNVSLLTHYDPEDSSAARLRWAFLPSLLWFPYFWAFWRLRDITEAGRIKNALALAVSWSSLGALCLPVMAVASWTEKAWQTALIMSVLALLHFALFGGAIKIYYSMERERGDLLILGARFSTIVLIAVFLATIIPSSSFLDREHMETSAAEALRTVNVAQARYAQTHPDKGFAASLEELGPAPGAGLINVDLAKGRRYNYYIISLTSALPDPSGHIRKYTLTARPAPSRDRGRRSFFSDEASVIHYTAADRSATANDRVLP